MVSLLAARLMYGFKEFGLLDEHGAFLVLGLGGLLSLRFNVIFYGMEERVEEKLLGEDGSFCYVMTLSRGLLFVKAMEALTLQICSLLKVKTSQKTHIGGEIYVIVDDLTIWMIGFLVVFLKSWEW
ncbi:hypothetical protein Lal_00031630 [Lupinus albus]|nr:hypothetical protein Lal_00031630 [Lupinus albus]